MFFQHVRGSGSLKDSALRPTDRLGGLKVVEGKNPSLGETIDIEKVRNAYISARENAAEESIFRQLRLNQWVKQSTRWMQMDKWNTHQYKSGIIESMEKMTSEQLKQLFEYVKTIA